MKLLVRVPLPLSVMELVALTEGLQLGEGDTDRVPLLLKDGAPDEDTDACAKALAREDMLALTDGLMLGPIVSVCVLLFVMGTSVGLVDVEDVRVKLGLAVLALRVKLAVLQRDTVGVTVSVVDRVRDSELVAQLV